MEMAESIITVKKGNKYFVIENEERSSGKNVIWIKKEDGEGGGFPEEEFFDAIEKYYKKNF